MQPSSNSNRESLLPVLGIFILAAVSCLRVWTIDGTMWDDNAWLMSAYASNSLQQFLNTGFVEMRRVPLGIVLYPLFWLHKNTDLYYVIWHNLNMVTQIGGPLLLYATCLRLFDNQRLLAFLIAATLAVISLDQTLPYASAINYRIGLFLGIASIYLTVRSLQSAYAWAWLAASLITAFIGYTVFVEAVMMLEPGRFAVMMYLLHRQRGKKGTALVQAAFLRWLPFIIACVPFALYKLNYKSFGFYDSMYRPNPLFWMNWQDNVNLAAFLLLSQWVIFLGYASKVSAWSVAMGAVSIATLIPLLKALVKTLDRTSKSTAVRKRYRPPDVRWHLAKHALYIGLVLMVPSLLLFQFVGRPVTWGVYSSHGTIGQFGYAMVIGSLLFVLIDRARIASVRKRQLSVMGTVLFFSLGVFFSNLNLDLYRYSHEEDKKFWKEFTARFPTLPRDAIFLFDVKNASFYHPMYYYCYEFKLNLLYAESLKSNEFRQYRVYTSYELFWLNNTNDPSRINNARFNRPTLWGLDKIDTAKFIAVYYDERLGLLINKEIVQKFPNAAYRTLLDKPFPELPPKRQPYLLRPKLDVSRVATATVKQHSDLLGNQSNKEN